MKLAPRLFAMLKRRLRPLLLPMLRRAGWRPHHLRIPHVSNEERLLAKEVPTRVTIREDSTILLNGDPFFPIGLYYAQEEMADASGASLRQLREMGFNTVFFGGAMTDVTLLDRIRDAGLYVWYRPPGALVGDFERLKQVVMTGARHAALLFWEMDDEPVLNRLDLEAVRAGCDLVRRIDPHHPILCTQWFTDHDESKQMMQWAELADVNAFGVYPVPLWRWGERLKLVAQGFPHSIAVVGAQTRLWRRYSGGKPVIPVLQAWAPNSLEDGLPGYPTCGEGRFMAYQAVIAGAAGLHHYGQHSIHAPNVACGVPPRLLGDLEQTHSDYLEAVQHNRVFWESYAPLIKELASMASIFTCRDAPWNLAVAREANPGTIERRVKRHPGGDVALVVNANAQATRVKFIAPQWINGTLNVWQEGRSIRVDAVGEFEDELGGHAVRIYSDAPDLLTGRAK